jgi:sec-independent protein translocase protein TatA
MPFVGTGHIWILGILLIIILIIWGPGKLPDVGSGIGRGIREFRRASAETKAEFSKEAGAATTGAGVAPAASPEGAPEAVIGAGGSTRPTHS